MGVALSHSGPDSVFPIGKDRKHLAVTRVGGIEIPVAHKTLFFVSFSRSVIIGTKNTVICDCPYSTVGGGCRLCILVAALVLDVFGNIFCVVNRIAVNQLLKISDLVYGTECIVVFRLIGHAFCCGFHNGKSNGVFDAVGIFSSNYCCSRALCRHSAPFVNCRNRFGFRCPGKHTVADRFGKNAFNAPAVSDIHLPIFGNNQSESLLRFPAADCRRAHTRRKHKQTSKKQ